MQENHDPAACNSSLPDPIQGQAGPLLHPLAGQHKFGKTQTPYPTELISEESYFIGEQEKGKEKTNKKGYCEKRQ